MSESSVRGVLLAVAAPSEARAVLLGLGFRGSPLPEWSILRVEENVDLVLTGVGKSNAAGGVARVADASCHGCVLNVGIAGSLPGGPGLGAVVLATTSVFADEGVETPQGFRDCGLMGFAACDLGMAVPGDASLAIQVGREADVRGPIACVSTCSGTDARALEVRRRSGGVAESMEGAAAGLAAYRVGIPFAEVRVISNTTGKREDQRWELEAALERLRALIGPLVREANLVHE